MEKICLGCGKRFLGYKNTKYCLFCSNKDESKNPPQIFKFKLPIKAGEIKMNERKCIDCGKDISDRHLLAQRCRDCAITHKKEIDRGYHFKNNKTNYKRGSYNIGLRAGTPAITSKDKTFKMIFIYPNGDIQSYKVVKEN